MTGPARPGGGGRNADGAAPASLAPAEARALNAALQDCVALAKAGHADRARAKLETIAPKLPAAVAARARLHVCAAAGDGPGVEAAIDALAGEATPGDFVAAADGLEAMGDRPSACALGRRAVDSAPGHAGVRRHEIHRHLRAGLIADAALLATPLADALAAPADGVPAAMAEDAAILGQVAAAMGDFAGAVALFDRVLAVQPGAPRLRLARAAALADAGDCVAAIAAVEEVLAVAPDNADAWANLGVFRQRQGEWAAAEAAYRAALTQAATAGLPDARPRANLAMLLRLAGRRDEAEAAIEAAGPAALAASAPLAAAAGLLAKDRGEAALSYAHYSRAVALDPGNRDHQAQRLMVAQFGDDLTPAGAQALAKSFARTFQPAVPPWAASGGGDGTVRVGIVTGALRQHPVGSFLRAVVGPHRAAGVHLTLYDVGRERDGLGDRLAAAADRTRAVAAASLDDLAQRIRADRIDVLLDCAGPVQDSRLDLYRRRPAPVQAKWVGGQFGTLGVPGLDHFLTDPVSSPPGAEDFHLERLVRLPGNYVAFAPPEAAPPVADGPTGRGAGPVFGCFNQAAKLTPGTLALWAAVLAAVPGSRLRVRATAFDRPAVATAFRARAAAAGIADDRLDLAGGLPHDAFLAAFAEVDAILDPRPFSGGHSTVEALWMGVPVIAWPGQTFASRHSAAHLTAAGCSEWIAADRDEYVAKAAAAIEAGAGDRAARQRLRDRVAASPLTDAAGFTAGWADTLRHLAAL